MRDGAVEGGDTRLQAETLSALLQELARGARGDADEAWSSPLFPGQRVGGLELVRELGRGGFGVVWEARDPAGRSVALKAVRPGRRERLREERLLREAEAAARLSHPNLVTLLGAGRSEAGPYLTLELLVGRTVAERLERGPLPLEEALRVALEVARGIAHAHAQGVVHRDLKPENVFLCDDGRVKVLDLGLAHAFGHRRAEGGTAGYMAPEQAAGAPEDERTDVFAIGVLLFEMLSGERPRQRRGWLGAPSLEARGLPALADLVRRALEPEPVARPRDAGALVPALEALRADAAGLPPGGGAVRVRRRPGALAVVASAVVAAALVHGGGVRVAPPPGAAPVRAGADGRVAIAVADLSNRTGDPDLDALAGLIVSALQETPSLRVIAGGRMRDALKKLGHAGAGPIAAPLVREGARRLGASALLQATVDRAGDEVSLEVQVRELSRDTALLSAKELGPKRDVLALVDRIAARVRRELAPSDADRARAVPAVAEMVTPNLEAYRHYAAGQALHERRLEGAMDEFEKAIALQPDFALARFALARRAWNEGRSAREVRALMGQALHAAERAPFRERLLIRAWNAAFEDRPDEARALYRELLERYPDDKEAIVDLAAVTTEPAEALGLAQRALEIDPEYEQAWPIVADSLAALGRPTEVVAAARAWSETATSMRAIAYVAEAFALGGDLDAALVAARRAVGLSPGALRVLADIHELRGEYREEERAARRLLEVTGRGWARLGVALRHQGRRREALRILDRAQESGRSYGAQAAFTAFAISAAEGGIEVRERAQRLLAHDPGLRPQVAAAFAVGGDPAAAKEFAAGLAADDPVRRLVNAVELGPEEPRARAALLMLTRHPRLEIRRHALFALGAMCAEAGDARCTVEALTRFRCVPAAGPGTNAPWATSHARLLMARAQVRSGHPELARRDVETVLAAWRRADADLPDLAEAKAICRQARCRAAGDE